MYWCNLCLSLDHDLVKLNTMSIHQRPIVRQTSNKGSLWIPAVKCSHPHCDYPAFLGHLTQG